MVCRFAIIGRLFTIYSGPSFMRQLLSFGHGDGGFIEGMSS